MRVWRFHNSPPNIGIIRLGNKLPLILLRSFCRGRVAEEEILDRFVQGVEEPGFSHFSQQAGAVKQVAHPAASSENRSSTPACRASAWSPHTMSKVVRSSPGLACRVYKDGIGRRLVMQQGLHLVLKTLGIGEE